MMITLFKSILIVEGRSLISGELMDQTVYAFEMHVGGIEIILFLQFGLFLLSFHYLNKPSWFDKNTIKTITIVLGMYFIKKN